MDPIVLSAIKKAKEELALKLESGTSGTGSALAQLKSSLEAKLLPWTGTRAAKLDRLDTTVSSRADGSYYTPARANKLDKLDATVSSRLSKTDFDTGSAAVLDKIPDVKDWTPARATKVDMLDAPVSTRQAAWGATLTHASRIDTAISSRATQSSVDSLSTIMKRGFIKSIQQGTILTKDRYSDGIYVTINTVVPSKCITIAQWRTSSGGGSSRPHGAILTVTSSSKLYIETNDSLSVGWQVIEFY